MKLEINKILLPLLLSCLIVISCHKKHNTPEPSYTFTGGCSLLSEDINGVKADSFVYNSNNQPSKIILYDSTGSVVTATLSITYDTSGRYSKINFSQGNTAGYVTFEYNAQNQLIGQYTYISIPFFGAQKIDSVNFAYVGNNISKETNYTIANSLLGTKRVVAVSYYTYDGNGNVLTETDSTSGALTDTYTYTYASEISPQVIALSNAAIDINNGKYPDFAYFNSKNTVLTMTHKDGSGNVLSDSYTSTYAYNSNGYPNTELRQIGNKNYNYLYNYSCK